MQYDVLVIGAGQAGLATAYALAQAGLSYRVLEAGNRAAGSWPRYYDSLTLFSPARYAGLPGLPFPGEPERYPGRDEVGHYLSSYARHHNLAIDFNAEVTTVRREDDGLFLAVTADGRRLRARAIVSASGTFGQPNLPKLPGIEAFQGRVLHSSEYRGPGDVLGTRVAVVGAGNSAVQIAYELSDAHRVTLVTREPLKFMNQRPLGRDVHFWLRNSGLDRLPLGAWLNWRPTEPVLDRGLYRKALREGRIAWRGMFETATVAGLRWADECLGVDTLLLATGFSSRKPYLEGLDSLSAEEAGSQRAGIARRVPGLYFVGGVWQRAHASATLRGVGADAAYVVKRLQRDLRSGATMPAALARCEHDAGAPGRRQ